DVPGNFHIGSAKGVTAGDITYTRTDTSFTLTFAPGSFGPGDALEFGTGVFESAVGFTTITADRFDGAIVTVKFDDNSTRTGTFIGSPKLPINLFTGAGLINADKATRAPRK